ncbi:MAG: 50S ribosomal protein L11 methyltransferase [Myxococcota bacterium]
MILDGLRPLPYSSRQEDVVLRGASFRLWRPPSPEQLLDALIEGPPDPDDKMPYWADLWPSALALAERLLTQDLRNQSVVELGCGLGLSALAAAHQGAHVLATDWDEDALRYVEASAKLNEFQVDTGRLDWRTAAPLEQDLLIGADLLYEARNVPWLLAIFKGWTGSRALLADPGRKPAVNFVAELQRVRFVTVEKVWIENPLVPRGKVDVDLIEIGMRK